MHKVQKELSKYQTFGGAVEKLLRNFNTPTGIYKNLL